MIWFYSVVVAFVAAVVAALFTGLSEEKRPATVGIITFIIALAVNLLVSFLFTPYFTHPLTDGFAALAMVDLVLATLVCGVTEMATDDDSYYGTLGLFLTLCVGGFLWVVVANVFYTPGAPCDVNAYKRMASIIPVTDMKSVVYPDTDLDHLIQVAPETAALEASRTLGGDANLGSYLKVGNPYLQKVGDHYYYIVNLKISDWFAFKARGGVIPGYIVVDAQSPGKKAELRTGYNIRFDNGAAGWSDQNLDRHVYFDYLLGTGWRVDDLDGGLEVDDDWNPLYTGTLLRHEIGFKGNVPDGVIVVDPQSGSITRYGMDKVPAWVDRIYSLDYIQTYLTWWGDWAARDNSQCLFVGTANQRKIDSDGYVVTFHGLVAEITMTSKNADQSLTEIIYVNLRTGQAQKYEISGAIEQSVQHLVEEKSKTLNAEGYNAGQCQVQNLLSQQVWYCILIGRAGGKAVSAGSFAGYAFVQTKNTANNTQVIVTKSTLQDAYDQLRSQIAGEGNGDPALSEALKKVQFMGLIDRKSDTFGDTGVQYVIFTLRLPQPGGEIDPSGLIFRISTNGHPVAALMREGDEVVVSAYQVSYDNFTDVLAVQDKALPGFLK